MVTVTNGSRTMTVSKGAFKALFEPIGWKEVEDENFWGLMGKKPLGGVLPGDDKNEAENANLTGENTEDSDDEDEEEPEDDEIETPISEMSVRELKAFAEKHDIDISEARNKIQLRAIVESYVEEK
nr:MAG TPA: HeH/LEM domain [Caudoviricetes sp.]